MNLVIFKNIKEDKSKLFNSSLSTIPLSIFNGNVAEFNNFKVAFENLINCHTYLSDTQKLFYLHPCL